MKRFKSARHVQRLVSIHDTIANLFHFPRHCLSSAEYRTLRAAAMTAWFEVASISTDA
jgi:putative transposase